MGISEFDTLVSLLTWVLVLPLEGTFLWPSATHKSLATEESPALVNHQFTGLPPINLPIPKAATVTPEF